MSIYSRCLGVYSDCKGIYFQVSAFVGYPRATHVRPAVSRRRFPVVLAAEIEPARGE
jgi:hypothetical protein